MLFLLVLLLESAVYIFVFTLGLAIVAGVFLLFAIALGGPT